MRRTARISVRDVLYLLFRDKNRILLITLVSFLGACTYLAFQSSIYVAESRVLVRIGKEKLSGVEPLSKDSYNILFQERPPDIHNGLELLRDPELSYTVYHRLKALLVPATAAHERLQICPLRGETGPEQRHRVADAAALLDGVLRRAQP